MQEMNLTSASAVKAHSPIETTHRENLPLKQEGRNVFVDRSVEPNEAGIGEHFKQLLSFWTSLRPFGDLPRLMNGQK